MVNDFSHQYGSRFTLRQLLALVTVLACFMALGFPALSQSKEAAWRIQCANNLKQYGLAIHNYHDVFNSIPPGGLWNVSSENRACPAPSWQLRVLPFIEQ